MGGGEGGSSGRDDGEPFCASLTFPAFQKKILP